MRALQPLSVLIAGAMVFAADVSAQATGLPSFNAPYRAFTRSELGVVISFPDNAGTAFEGVYRMSSGAFDIGFRVGMLDTEGPGDAVLLLGAEARQRVITHTPDFPLDGALILGIGGAFSDNSAVFIPIGLSLGRRINPRDSKISIVPYVQPTGLFVAANGVSDFVFGLGLGADFRLSPRFDARISFGLGDLEGVSLGAVWVH